MRKNTCPVEWNPGEWPYATRCAKDPGHDGGCVNGRGVARPARTRQEIIADAVNSVVTLLTSPVLGSPSLHRDKCRTLAMEWPSLAAALAVLVGSAGGEVPSPLRRALTVLDDEQTRSHGQAHRDHS